MTERANKLAVYYLNINKRYDLDVRTTFYTFVELSLV